MRLFKAHGAHNTFIIALTTIELTEKLPVDLKSYLIHTLFEHECDSVMIVGQGQHGSDCSMRVLEQDGSESQMCGNGVRTVALLLHLLLQKSVIAIQVPGRTLMAHVLWSDGRSKGEVSISMGAFTKHTTTHLGKYTCILADVGEPHGVIVVNDIREADHIFQKRGLEFVTTPRIVGAHTSTCNLNLVERVGKTTLHVRTFERGVNKETRACGTGATCAANVISEQYGLKGDISVILPGGLLSITPGKMTTMKGPAHIISEILTLQTHDKAHKKHQRV